MLAYAGNIQQVYCQVAHAELTGWVFQQFNEGPSECCTMLCFMPRNQFSPQHCLPVIFFALFPVQHHFRAKEQVLIKKISNPFRKLEELEGKPYLTTAEETERKKLKKLKLRGKDKIEEILCRYRSKGCQS